MSNIISVENLIKTFGSKDGSSVQVLKRISFDIEEKEFVSIMGPSGCGKSTLLYLIGGLDSPTYGKIIICGNNIHKLNDSKSSYMRRKDIGFVFQFYNLVPNLTVQDNILLPVIMNGSKINDYKQYLDQLLEIIGLTNKRKSYPNELSGGQQQRVSIARALIMNPKILLADEPTGNLDSQSGEDIMQLFKKVNKELGVTILQVTHNEDIANNGNRIIKMIDGKIISDIKINSYSYE